MNKIFAVLIASLFLWGCSSGNRGGEETPVIPATPADSLQDETQASQSVKKPASYGPIDSLRMGMSGKEVIGILGEPTRKESTGADPKMKIEDWWFGENQKVRMMDGKVNHVVKDVGHQRELFKQLVQARKDNDEAEIARIMEELTAGNK